MERTPLRPNRPLTGVVVPPVMIMAAMLGLLPGCQVIGDIFKAGVWVGVIVVAVVIAGIAGLARMFAR